MNGRLAGLALIAGLALATPAPSAATDEAASIALLVKTLAEVEDAAVQKALMQGMLNGLAGQRNISAPAQWKRVAGRLARSEDNGVRELASQLSQIFGDEEAIRRALGMVQDRSAASEARRRALHSLLAQQDKRVSALLAPLLADPDLRLDAIRGYAAIENARAPEILLGHYPTWSAEHRKAILETLATRKKYALALLDAVKRQKIPKSDIPAHVARSLSLLLGDSFVSIFGDVRQLARDRAALMAGYKKMLTDESLAAADASQGRAIFKKTCATCHMLYGTGGKIGPDLTGSNRANLDYILLNSVDPSYDVPEGYKMVVIRTLDGRVLNGVIAEENSQRVVLKTVEQPLVVVPKEDIQSRRVSDKSMMPEGQFEQMKPQEIKNLVKYLQTIEQVEAPQ